VVVGRCVKIGAFEGYLGDFCGGVWRWVAGALKSGLLRVI